MSESTINIKLTEIEVRDSFDFTTDELVTQLTFRFVDENGNRLGRVTTISAWGHPEMYARLFDKLATDLRGL